MTNLYRYDDMTALGTLSLTRKTLLDDIHAKVEKIGAFTEALKAGMFPGFTVCEQQEDLVGLEALAESWAENFEHAIFLGVGGSSLGAQTLVSFMGKFAKTKVKLHFLDNVDPFTMEQLINAVPLEKTVVISVSKSGGTIETLSQTLLLADAFTQQKLPLSLHMLGITEDKDSPLRAFLTEYEIPTLNHAKDIGGRFTVLSLVGILPAIMAGLNVADLRAGAAEVLHEFYQDPLTSQATYGAAFAVKAGEMGRSIHYMMPYSDRLQSMSDWYVQLWAESLGKEGKGTTPVPAVGSTDQHSALQMLMEGPKDKVVSIILPDCSDEGRTIKSQFAALVEEPYLDGLNLGKLMYNQAHGTADALNDNAVPVRTFYTEKLDEKVLGALLMHFMLETAVAGILLDVNTWDQPGVEEGKKRTMDYLTRSIQA
ncbi:MAG: glucose-6-phosphate isomerase [Alphaproteobacteria bacterium]|jgi:glucose-6-phosphate isomerase